MPKWQAYTDGGCIDNSSMGGAGGMGIHLQYGEQVMEWSYGYVKTTNNRMEIRAIIFILEQFQDPVEIEVLTDSQYAIDGSTKWIHGWRRNNWVTAGGESVKNKDLFIRLDELQRFHKVTLTKVKGHSGIPGNERADELATLGIKNAVLIDEGFIPAPPKPPGSKSGYKKQFHRKWFKHK